MADFARSEFNGSIPNLICLGTRLWSSASMHAYAYAGAHSDLRAFYVMTSLCAPTYKQQQTALDSGEIWEGADVDSIQIRHLRTDAASQIRRLRTDATFKDLLLRLNSLPQFRFVTSQLTLLQRFVALHAVVDIFTIRRLEKLTQMAPHISRHHVLWNTRGEDLWSKVVRSVGARAS